MSWLRLEKKETSGTSVTIESMDPAERVYTPRQTRRVVLRDNVDTRNWHVWDVVLQHFIAMGATRTSAKADAWRLQYDSTFHHKWASSLPLWYPTLARYVSE